VGSNQKADTGFTNLTRSLYEGDMLGLFDAGEDGRKPPRAPRLDPRRTAVQEAELRRPRRTAGRQLLDTLQDYAFDSPVDAAGSWR
jgi:hypothetical protein